MYWSRTYLHEHMHEILMFYNNQYVYSPLEQWLKCTEIFPQFQMIEHLHGLRPNFHQNLYFSINEGYLPLNDWQWRVNKNSPSLRFHLKPTTVSFTSTTAITPLTHTKTNIIAVCTYRSLLDWCWHKLYSLYPHQYQLTCTSICNK